MSNLKLLFRSRKFLLLLLVALLSRIFLSFRILPQTPSPYGPDEGTYALLSNWVAQGKSMENFPLFGPGLYNSARSVALPSALFIKLGLYDLHAVRLVSSLYASLSIVVLSLLYLQFESRWCSKHKSRKIELRLSFYVLIGIYSFWPSNFLWSILGLRETASQFWIVTTFYFLMIAVRASLVKSKVLSLFGFTLSLIFAFGSRKETALVFSAATLFLSLLLLINRVKSAIPITGASILGILCGFIFTLTPVVNGVISNEEPTSIEKSIDPLDSAKSQLAVVANLDEKREVNRIGASSALPASSCTSLESPKIEWLFCNLKELPLRLVAFLARPFPFMEDGSQMLKLAGIENIMWIVLILYTLVMSLKNRNEIYERLIFAHLIIYLSLFSSAAALYEGNLGTAFRHKSTLLWVLILLSMVFQCKKQFSHQIEKSRLSRRRK